MFTRKRLPNINLTGDWKNDGPRLVKWISDYFGSLEAPDSLTIDEAAITATNGIQFPATQNASSDVNTLDDYEEGPWTPAGNGITFSAVGGSYTKIGDMVFARFNVVFPVTANTSTARIQGLPFTVGGAGGDYGAGYLATNNSGNVTIVAPVSGQTYANLANNSGGTYTNANFSNSQIVGIIIYTIS